MAPGGTVAIRRFRSGGSQAHAHIGTADDDREQAEEAGGKEMVGFVARVAMAGGCAAGVGRMWPRSGLDGQRHDPRRRRSGRRPPPPRRAPPARRPPRSVRSNRTKPTSAQLHDRFFRMMVRAGTRPNPNHPEIAATTTGHPAASGRTEFVQTDAWSWASTSRASLHGEILGGRARRRRPRRCARLHRRRLRRAVDADGCVVDGDDGTPVVTELRAHPHGGRMAGRGLVHGRRRAVRRLIVGACVGHLIGSPSAAASEPPRRIAPACHRSATAVMPRPGRWAAGRRGG